MADPIRILVLCTGNRCRSQMAEGWLEHFGGDRAIVKSAGTKPKGVHPLSIRVMDEVGVDISSHTSEHVDKYVDEPFDYVITVCDSAKEACPVFPGAGELIHHSFLDPDQPDASEEDLLPVFREIRDTIRDWAEAFIAQHAGSATG